ncbi:hypothetical protein C8R44DRAFT_872322 [Mycena epipterygia]|nr:hypothetical protein C8R44DRAFT_872322 [Mycena epipterygia]
MPSHPSSPSPSLPLSTGDARYAAQSWFLAMHGTTTQRSGSQASSRHPWPLAVAAAAPTRRHCGMGRWNGEEAVLLLLLVADALLLLLAEADSVEDVERREEKEQDYRILVVVMAREGGEGSQANKN